MITKETRLERMEVYPNGEIHVLLKKCIVEDGEIIGEPRNHRLSLLPTTKFESFLANVNEDIGRTGYPPVRAVDADLFRKEVALWHTPQRVAQFKIAFYQQELAPDKTPTPEQRARLTTLLRAAEADLAAAGGP